MSGKSLRPKSIILSFPNASVGNPNEKSQVWIPAFAGMTAFWTTNKTTRRLKRRRRKGMRYITVLLLCISLATAQDATKSYEIPFASKGNIIELSVANSSTLMAEEVKVEVTAPQGIKFAEKTVILPTLKSKEEQTASFSFSVEKIAQVNKEQTLSFTITDKTGQKWTKDIKVKITPPTTYELYQNYPNPFNPTTIMEYQLPGTGTRFNVSLKVYDVIGREVSSLVNEQQEPGYYQKTFDASRYASGMYVYQLIATDAQNNKHIFKKKMMLLR
jgi:hypothetical protein